MRCIRNHGLNELPPDAILRIILPVNVLLGADIVLEVLYAIGQNLTEIVGERSVVNPMGEYELEMPRSL